MTTTTSTATTGFHITHWKSGSQWVRAMIRRLAPDRMAAVHGSGSLDGTEIQPGAIYSPVYMHKQWFDRFAEDQTNSRQVVVIRDLRDTAVSWYFSMLHSHPKNPAVDKFRKQLGATTKEEGLLLTLDESVKVMSRLQLSWQQAPETTRLMIRYEDLIADTYTWMGQLVEHLGILATDQALRETVDAESFENKTGRKPGEEDVNRHQRKGVAGDWVNHFTDRVKDAFKERYGQTLIETGYEQDLNW